MNFFRRDANLTFIQSLAIALVLGSFFRLYLLGGQIFADDEWHGLYYVIGKTPFWLMTHFSIPGATCIPLNFYTWAIGKTVGWSETVLRLPSIVFGILTIVICPLAARETIGARRAAWFALFLAICPLLIFYSRISRPYSAVAFFGSAALLFAAQWMKNGKRLPGMLFVATGILAVYFHLFAIVTVAAPFLVVFIFYFIRREQIAFPLRNWILAAIVIAVVSAILLLPAFIHSIESTFFNIALTGSFSWESLPRAAMLMSGTGEPVLAVIFWILLIVGAASACRRNLLFGVTLVSLFPLHALALILSRPDSAQSAIVLVRYSIPMVPVSLLLVACGLESVLGFTATKVKLRPALQIVIVSAFIAAMTLTGPLPQCFVTPNNFTSHGAYQHRYGQIDWNRSFYSDMTPASFRLNTIIQVDELSPFYVMVAKERNSRPIVEYPMFIGDHFDPFYYYQHFHHRPVLIGYTHDMTLTRGLAAGNIYGNTYIDQVLSLANPSQLRFRNLVEMGDLAAMRERNVEFIVLHKRFESQLSLIAPPPPRLEALYKEYKEKLGEPCYEDANIAAFRL